MNRRFVALLLFVLPFCALATPPGVLRLDARAPMAETQKAVAAALEEARSRVVYEAGLGASMAGFADRWWEHLNRNAPDGIRSIVVCNAWYTNRVSNAAADLLALCPLRVNMAEKESVATAEGEMNHDH